MLFNNYLISLLGIGGVVGTIAGVGIVYSNQRSNKDIQKNDENAKSNIETKSDSLIKDTEKNEKNTDEGNANAQDEEVEVASSVEQPPVVVTPHSESVQTSEDSAPPPSSPDSPSPESSSESLPVVTKTESNNEKT